jgi:hypothetical protein
MLCHQMDSGRSWSSVGVYEIRCSAYFVGVVWSVLGVFAQHRGLALFQSPMPHIASEVTQPGNANIHLLGGINVAPAVNPAIAIIRQRPNTSLPGNAFRDAVQMFIRPVEGILWCGRRSDSWIRGCVAGFGR